jgi:LysR family glycine cleavage system transcriptional activator
MGQSAQKDDDRQSTGKHPGSQSSSSEASINFLHVVPVDATAEREATMPHLPSLTALRCFDASARHGSFTKAAAEVHLTQGGVSHQVIGLEELLGAPLFVRRRAGLQLTVAGQAYWREISPALRQIERATQDIVVHKGLGGALHLSAASSFGTLWLIPRLNRFVQAHPEIRLHLSTHVGPVDSARMPHDAAIEYCSGPTPGLHAQLICPLVLSPHASPALLAAHGLHGRAGRRPPVTELLHLLSAAPLIRHASEPLGWPRWLEAAGMGDRLPAVQLSSGPQYDLVSMALHGAIAGQGVALLPDWAADGAVATGQLRRLSDLAVEAGRGYYLRCPDWKAELPPVRRFADWLRSEMAG